MNIVSYLKKYNAKMLWLLQYKVIATKNVVIEMGYLCRKLTAQN